MHNPISRTTSRSSYSTTVREVYDVSVPLEKIQEKWYANYHPAGYGTTVEETRVTDTERHVRVHFYNSCD